MRVLLAFALMMWIGAMVLAGCATAPVAVTPQGEQVQIIVHPWPKAKTHAQAARATGDGG